MDWKEWQGRRKNFANLTSAFRSAEIGPNRMDVLQIRTMLRCSGVMLPNDVAFGFQARLADLNVQSKGTR
jgi:hypothetical protein